MQDQSAAKDFANLVISRHPDIEGVTFRTFGPKPRRCYFWRQGNGVTILLDAQTGEPLGWVEFEGQLDAVTVLPLVGTLNIAID